MQLCATGPGLRVPVSGMLSAPDPPDPAEGTAQVSPCHQPHSLKLELPAGTGGLCGCGVDLSCQLAEDGGMILGMGGLSQHEV